MKCIEEIDWSGIQRRVRRAWKIVLIVFLLNITLIMLKAYVYVITLSLTVLAYLVDSLFDILNDMIVLLALRRSSKPPDMDHPYGHGKYEALARVVLSLFLLFTAINIIFEGIKRFLSKEYYLLFPRIVFYILPIFLAAYAFISILELYFSRKLELSILESSSLHYITDPMTTIIVIGAVYFSSMGFWYIDIVGSIIICGIIIYSFFKIFSGASSILLDKYIIEPNIIRNLILEAFKHEVKDVHAIKSRSDGFGVYLEFHLLVAKDFDIESAHKLSHDVEEYLRKVFRNINFHQILIHIEPFEGD